ncbi:hypothetical protein [Cohnella lupini]|uniref:Uncharacterized protein n=1 Tax=Cohnella lupini TaxID=1294267 RepID=A0A3D9HTZ8_9BACL|nr:hypothetical protein [Cohnella lupini]RED52992.1 hypothetical protein DFP95_12851 [Cohnella lupini]
MQYLKMHPFKLVILAITLVIIIVIFNQVSSNQPISSNTTSYIEVLEIGVSDDDLWAMVKNPYDSKATPFKLVLDSINTKNLIVVGSKYFVTYETNLKTKKSVLNIIRYPAESK